MRCLRSAMERGGYAMVASHDPTIISIAQELARRNDIEPDGYEHQMFYGVRPLEQRRLVDIGHRCRTYVPFGPAWYGTSTAQISARPRAAYNYLRALGTSGDGRDDGAAAPRAVPGDVPGADGVVG